MDAVVYIDAGEKDFSEMVRNTVISLEPDIHMYLK
jgi:hypothetical protein